MVCSSLSTRDDCQQRSKHTPGWKDRHWPVLLWCNQAAVFFKQSFTGKGTRCAGLAHLLGAGLRGVSWVCKYWVPVFPRKGPRHTFLDVWTQPFCPHGPGHRGKSSNTKKVLQRAQLSTGISQPMEVQEILADTLFQVAPPQRMQGRLNSPQDAWGSLGGLHPHSHLHTQCCTSAELSDALFPALSSISPPKWWPTETLHLLSLPGNQLGMSQAIAFGAPMDELWVTKEVHVVDLSASNLKEHAWHSCYKSPSDQPTGGLLTGPFTLQSPRPSATLLVLLHLFSSSLCLSSPSRVSSRRVCIHRGAWQNKRVFVGQSTPSLEGYCGYK